MDRRKTRRQGFSLLEAIVTVAVIAIPAAIAIPAVFKYYDAGRKAACDKRP